jgi:DNA polymerase I
MPLSKLVLIDGHSLAYRAFYGLPLYDRGGKVHFTNARGEFTNAVYGFCNMLLKVWADERPDGIAVAFDLGRTFRDDLYEPYKGSATRCRTSWCRKSTASSSSCRPSTSRR